MTADAWDSNVESERLRVMTIAHAVDHWLGELERSNKAERTIDTYRRLLDKLADAHPLIDISEVTPALVRRFLDSQARLRNGGRKDARTIAQNVSIVNCFFDWLRGEDVIKRNPTRRNEQRILSRPRLGRPEENDNVKTVSTEDVRRLVTAANESGWPKRLAVNIAVYSGARRAALSMLQVSDYDRDEGTLAFCEKGSQPIVKPVPWPLIGVLEAAGAAGVYETADDYLIPNLVSRYRKDGAPNEKFRSAGKGRSDKIIWKLVTGLANDVGVETHVHALRAAFATYYLETHQEQNSLLALQRLLGHKRIETTLVYLRRLNRRQAMETVRDLDWGVTEEERFELSSQVSPTNALAGRHLRPLGHSSNGSSHFASKLLVPRPDQDSVGRQPSMLDHALLDRVQQQHEPFVPGKTP